MSTRSHRILAAFGLVALVALDACSAADPAVVGSSRTRRGAAAAGSSDGTDPGADDPGSASTDAPTSGAPVGGSGSGSGAGTGTGTGTGGTTADAGAADAATGDFTRGSGGAAGFAERVSTGGLTYQIDAPAGATPHGLLVLLHGSTASNYAQFVGMMASVASQYDLIRVSALAPNRQGWNEGDQVAAARLLNDLVQQDLFAKYNIDKAKVLFSGQSSGGGFLASHFIPLYAKNYRGGALLQCGMAPPYQTFTPDAATKLAFRMHFEITTGDTIWPQSYRNAVAAYTTAGMQFTKTDDKPGGHCNFDQQQIIRDNIAFLWAAR